MRYVVLAGALAVAGCGIGVQHESAKAPPPPQHAPAPMQSGIAASPHSVADISNVQQRLGDEGLYHGPMDGQWGAQTATAMRAYQRQHDLPVTGVADHATLVQMDLE